MTTGAMNRLLLAAAVVLVSGSASAHMPRHCLDEAESAINAFNYAGTMLRGIERGVNDGSSKGESLPAGIVGTAIVLLEEVETAVAKYMVCVRTGQ